MLAAGVDVGGVFGIAAHGVVAQGAVANRPELIAFVPLGPAVTVGHGQVGESQ